MSVCTAELYLSVCSIPVLYQAIVSPLFNLSVCLSVCLPVFFLSVYLSVIHSFCLCWLSPLPSLHVCVCVCLCLCVCVCVCVCVYICLVPRGSKLGRRKR